MYRIKAECKVFTNEDLSAHYYIHPIYDYVVQLNPDEVKVGDSKYELELDVLSKMPKWLFDDDNNTLISQKKIKNK